MSTQPSMQEQGKARKAGLGCGWVFFVIGVAGVFQSIAKGAFPAAAISAGVLIWLVPLGIRELTRFIWEPVWQQNRGHKILAPLLWVGLGAACFLSTFVVGIVLNYISAAIFGP